MLNEQNMTVDQSFDSTSDTFNVARVGEDLNDFYEVLVKYDKALRVAASAFSSGLKEVKATGYHLSIPLVKGGR